MNEAADGMFGIAFEDGFFGYFIDLKVLVGLSVLEIELKRVVIGDDFIDINLALTVSNVGMAE